MFCYLFYYTGRQNFGFAIPGIQSELGLSKEAIGWISGVLLWSYAIGQAINGNLGDKYGGRRMMALGAFFSCILNWFVSLSSGLMSLLIPWGANGYAQSMGWAPGSRIISNWWKHEDRGRAFGFYVFASGMSSVLTYATSILVIDELGLDWRWLFRLPVLLMLVGAIVFYFVVRERPDDLGFPSEGREDDTVSNPPTTAETSLDRYRAVFSNWRFLVASLAIGFQNAARYGLLIWVPVHFLGDNFKDHPGGKWISLALPVGMALGALSNGWLSDVFFQSRRSGVISLFMALAAVACGTMYVLPQDDRWLGIAVLFLCGFFAYGPQAAFWALCPDLLGTTRAATGVGIMNMFAYLVAGFAEPLLGRTIESYNNDTTVIFPFVAGACCISAVLALIVRR